MRADIRLSPESSIYVAGHTGLVGSAIVRRLHRGGFTNILTATRHELDLRDQTAVHRWFEVHRPEFVFLVAGTVGGILANATRPAEFIYDNLMIHLTVQQAAHLTGTSKLLYLGSSCIYPKLCPQPMREEHLLTGALESTNEPYAVAKIAGLKMCESYRRQYGRNFISAMPTNLYGPNDNFDLTSSHVVPALVRKFHEARVIRQPVVEVWGSGTPRREFLHVDDLADACLFLMRHYNDASHINVGTGVDLSIRELADLIRRIVYPDATIVFNSAMPDGAPRKLLDVSRLHAMGWTHRIGLEEGITQTYQSFLQRPDQG
jgi:GDP-L-fucose synthase